MVDNSEILDTAEVGRILRVHPRTIARLAKEKKLPGFRVGNQWRFRRSAIEEYIRRQEQEAEAPPEQHHAAKENYE
jgi:excisionase family DNA binding protein